MDIPISRSERKRRLRHLDEVVTELCSLSAAVIDQIPCAPELRPLMKECAGLKGGARNRQIKYISKLLRDTPLEEIYDFLSRRQGAALHEKKQLHETEFYRDTLLNEAIAHERQCHEWGEEMAEVWPSRIIEEIGSHFPEIESTLLLRLARGYAKSRNRAHSREIFRILRAARERQDFALRQQRNNPSTTEA